MNRLAEARGVGRGTTLVDARAICPGLTARPADPEREATALAALRRWAGRYGPLVATDGDRGLIADISGVPHLFGGESALRDDVRVRANRMGLSVSTAIASTRGAAHALAHHGGGIVADGRPVEGIGHLPVSALRIDPDAAEALTRLGLGRIRDLVPLPRASLARRFGPELVTRFDQALGFQPEPVAAEPEPPRFAARMTLPDPIGLQADVMAALTRLLDRVCGMLETRCRGARRMRLELRRVDRRSVHVEIGLAGPMRDPQRIAPLFERGVAEVDAGFGIDGLRLVAHVTEPLAPVQTGDGPSGREGEALADLISSLCNRLGFDRVLRYEPADGGIPERAFRLVPAADGGAAAFPQRRGPPRPLTILPPEPVAGVSGRPPVRFLWRRRPLTVLRATGPERIAPEWWLDDPARCPGVRDYWRVETREGPRLWLLHLPQAAGGSARAGRGWFVHGVFP